MTYIPQSICWIESNIPETHNGFIVDDYRASGVIKGIIWVVKTIVVFICDNISELDTIFILIAMLGIFVIMAGFRKAGTKMTSGSIFGYIICKVVSELA